VRWARRKRTGLSLQSERPVQVPCRSLRKNAILRPVRASLRQFTNSTRVPKSRPDAGRVVSRSSAMTNFLHRPLSGSVLVFAVNDRGRDLGDLALDLAVSDRGVLLTFPVLLLTVGPAEIRQAEEVAYDVRSIV
jgi:hypothetical protein